MASENQNLSFGGQVISRHVEFNRGGEMIVSKKIFDTKKRTEKLVEERKLSRSEVNEIIRSFSIRIKDLKFNLMATVLFTHEFTNVDITKIVRGGGIGRISQSDMKVAMLTSGKPSHDLIEKFKDLFPLGKERSISWPPIPIKYAMDDDYSETDEVKIIVFENSYDGYGDASNFRRHQEFYDVLEHTAVFWTKNEDNDKPREDPKLQSYYALKDDLRRFAPNLVHRFLMVPLHSFPSYPAYEKNNHTQHSVNSYKGQLSYILRTFMRNNASVKTIHLWIQGSVRMAGKKNFIFRMNNKDLCKFFSDQAHDYLINGIHSLLSNPLNSIVKHLDQVDGVIDGDTRFPYYLLEVIHAYDLFHEDIVERGNKFLINEYHDKARRMNEAWYNHIEYNFTSLMLIGFPTHFVKLLLESADIDGKMSTDLIQAKMRINVTLGGTHFDNEFSNYSIIKFIKERPVFNVEKVGVNEVLRLLNDLKYTFFKINHHNVMTKILIKLHEIEYPKGQNSNAHSESLNDKVTFPPAVKSLQSEMLKKRFLLDHDGKGFFHEAERKCILFNLPMEVARAIYAAGIPISGVVVIDPDSMKYNISTRSASTLQPTDMKLVSKNMAELMLFARTVGITLYPTLFDALQPGIVLAASGTGKTRFVSSLDQKDKATDLSIHQHVLNLHNTYSKVPRVGPYSDTFANYGNRRDNVILLGLRTSCTYSMTHLSSSDTLLRLPSVGAPIDSDSKVPDCIIPNTTIIHNLLKSKKKHLAGPFNALLVSTFRKVGGCMSNFHYEYLHLCPNVKIHCVNIGDLIVNGKVDTFYAFHHDYGWKMYPVVRLNTLANGMNDESIREDIKATLDIINEFSSISYEAVRLLPSLFIATWKVDIKGFAGLRAMLYRSVFELGRNERGLQTLYKFDCLNASGHTLSAFLTPKSIFLHYLEEILFSNVSSPFSFPTNEPVSGRNFHSKEDYIAASKFAHLITTKIKDSTTSQKEHFMPYVNEMSHRILMIEVVIQYLD